MIDIYNKRITVQWVCGIAFFAIALTNMLTYISNDLALSSLPLYFVGNLAMLIVAIPIMINSKIKASIAASLMSISFGVYGFLENYEMTTLEGLPEYYFYFCILEMILGALIVLFGLGLLLGYNYNSERLKYTSIISLIVLAVLPLIYLQQGNFKVFWTYIKAELPSILFLGLLLVSLFSPEIRFYTAYNRLSKNIIFIREVFCVAKDSWIYRNDFRRLMNYKNEEWTPVGGPIIEEQTYVIHIYKSTLRLIIQRWENGTERLKIAQNRTSLIMDKINMQLTEIIPDGDIENCESFTVFGTDGMFIRLLVKDDKETRKARKKADKLMKDIDPEFETGDE